MAFLTGKIKLDLQTRFILITAFSIIVVMSILGFIAVKREKAIMLNEAERQGRLLAETLAIPIINDLIYERLGLVEEGGLLDNYIAGIFNKKYVELLYLMVLDETGRVISHNDILKYGTVPDDPFGIEAVEATHMLVRQFIHEETGIRALDVAAPLSIGKKRWGTLRFGMSLEKMTIEIRKTMINIVFITAGLLMLGFASIYLLSRRFIRPISELAETMEAAGAGNLDIKVSVKGDDEFAALGRSFNDMLARIKKANDDLRKAHEELVQKEKMAAVGNLAAGVAHEINNPLGGMLNCVSALLQPDADSAKREKYLDLLYEGLERIKNTVTKLLGFSQRRYGQKTCTDINKLIAETLSLLEYKLRDPEVRLDLRLDPGIPSMEMDEDSMRQVLLNIFLNALQAMPGGGMLSVKSYSTDSSVRIEVNDTGQGIEREHLRKIFDPFFTTKQEGEGTGLGLSISYGIVRGHGGDIRVASEPGRGSVFIVELPISGMAAISKTDLRA